ncbi:hypothetical protein TNCV_747431 [Trichonephila clavipes]|nr:hypothetical protein TNCV_747431 [Trichonephila clavipes]
MPRLQKVFKKRKGKYYPRKNTINSKVSTTDSKLNAQAEHAHDSKQSCAKEKKIPDLNESFSSFGDSVEFSSSNFHEGTQIATINTRFVYAMRSIGKGAEAGRMFCGSYYGSAIRRNHSSVQNMRQKAIWAIFLHSYQLMNIRNMVLSHRGKIHGVDLKGWKHQLPSQRVRDMLYWRKICVTWQAMVGRHILEEIVGRVAQYVDEHYPVDKWHLGDLIAWVAQSALKYRPRICELSKCLEGPLKMIVCPRNCSPHCHTL